MTDPFLDLAEQNVQLLKHVPRTHHPALENARQAVDNDPVTLARQTDEWRHNNRLWKILMLAPTMEIGEALLRGEHVPLERLDPVWVERFGLKDTTQEAA